MPQFLEPGRTLPACKDCVLGCINTVLIGVNVVLEEDSVHDFISHSCGQAATIRRLRMQPSAARPPLLTSWDLIGVFQMTRSSASTHGDRYGLEHGAGVRGKS